MTRRIGDTLRNFTSSLAERLTNSSVIPEGEELYDHSPLANTYEVIEAERRANGSFRRTLENVANRLHPGFTLDDVTFNVEKSGSGKQQFISTHYSHAFEPGFVGIFRGDYKIHDDKVTRTAKGDYSQQKLAEIFLEMVRNNLRLSIPRGVAQEISKERNMSYPHIEGILLDAFSEAKLGNPKSAEDIEETERLIVPGINPEDIVKNSIILKVVPYSKIRKVLFYNQQLATYKIREINPATNERVITEADPFVLAKQLSPESTPMDESQAIAEIIAAYKKNNPNKSIIVLTDPDEGRATDLGNIVSRLIGKQVPVEMIVSDRPLHHKKVYTVETPKKSNAKRYASYGVGAVAAAGIAALAYRGLFPNKFVHHNYQLRINGAPVESIETQITGNCELELFDNGKPVLTQKITTEQKDKKENNGKKKKKHGFW